MKLESEENIIKTFRHHSFPFAIKVLKILAVSFPFFFVASFFRGTLDIVEFVGLLATITTIFLLIIVYTGLIYYLDRLVVTNCRVVYIDWTSLFSRKESEAEFRDIQDIETKENGVLANLRIFDYGTIRIQTASTKITIIFNDANDPEGIKHFIYHLHLKPSTIKKEDSMPLIHDPTSAKQETKVTSTVVSGSGE